MDSTRPERPRNPPRRYLGITFFALVLAIVASSSLPSHLIWKLPLQLLLVLASLVVWLWPDRQGRFESRFEILMWVGILLATLSDILGFKALYYLFGVVAIVGLIGWEIRRPPPEKTDGNASKRET